MEDQIIQTPKKKRETVLNVYQEGEEKAEAEIQPEESKEEEAKASAPEQLEFPFMKE